MKRMRRDDWKPTVKLIEATRDIAERDLRLGLITESQLRFTVEARKAQAVELKAAGLSNRQIAKITRASPATIGRDLGISNETESVSNETPSHKHYRTLGTGEFEWYTPAEYVETVRKVLGVIDLDPASHEVAQRVVKAKKYYTKEDDGLTKEWHGRGFLNPPYSQPLITKFVSKLITEIHSGRTTQAILLTNNFTDTAWFHKAGALADAICFTRGRIRFVHRDGDKVAESVNGQAFYFFGDHVSKFVKHFGAYGTIFVALIKKPVRKETKRVSS
jgi:phage N-6-adenine-methyltransferase